MEAAEVLITPPELDAPESDALLRSEASVRDYLCALEGGQKRCPMPPKLVFEDGRQFELPPEVLRALQFALHHMACGDSFALISESQMLTTNEAARILNVSRPFLIQILDRGEIEYTKVGSHHRMLLGDVLKYKRQRNQRRETALARLVSEAQEAGDYFNE